MTMRRPQSLFGQLVMSQLLLLATIALVLPIIVTVSLRATADEYVSRRLNADAQRVAEFVDPGRPINTPKVVEALGPLYTAPWGSRAFVVLDASHVVLAHGGVHDAAPVAVPPGNKHVAHVGKLDVLVRSFRRGSSDYRIVVAQDRTRPEVIVDDVVVGFLRRTLWTIPLILAASTLIGLAIVRRVSRQLREASREADRIAPSTLDARIDGSRLPTEVRGLAAAANQALDRVASGYDQQRAFAGSVAHELRTPLALIALRCDALPDSPVRAGICAAIDQAAHVVDQLFALATIEGMTSLEPIDLPTVVSEAVDSLAPLVTGSGRSIDAAIGTGSGTPAGNARLLHIAIRNLVDNAIRHTDPGTRISLRTHGASIAVTDNGPGIRWNESASRYHRADASRTDGAGLGLAIVDRVMNAMGGAMHVRAGVAGTTIVLSLADAGSTDEQRAR